MASDGGDKQKKINSEASFSGRSANEQPTGSSVWSLCSIPSDIHAVDLRDITPSLSPVFTEDQVRELSGQTGDLDVLGDSFLPHDTFKRITEVLSPEQTNLLISTCTSLCSESDMLSYSDPVVGSIGHFTSQHDPILNTPPEKTPTMNVLNQDSNKNKELNELGSKHVASKAVEPSTSKDNSVVTRPKNTDKNEKTEANEKEDSSADENKLKTKQIKSSYSLRSSPRKAANDERGTAETPSRNRRQRSKKETTNETERRKSPRGQKQSSEKEESPLSENEPHGKRGKQKQEPKQPEQPKEGEEKEEEKKEEGMNLRRSSRKQRHEPSPVKPKTPSPKKGRGGRKKVTAESEESHTNTDKHTESNEKDVEKKGNEKIEEEEEEDKETTVEEKENGHDVEGKNEDGNKEVNETASEDSKKEIESSVPTSTGTETEQNLRTMEEILLEKETLPTRKGTVDANLLPSGEGTVATNLIPSREGTIHTNIIPPGVGTVDSNFISTELASSFSTGIGTIGANVIPTRVGTVVANNILTGVGTVGTNVIPTGVEIGANIIPTGVGTVDSDLIPVGVGTVGDILSVQNDILEIIEKEINLPQKERIHFDVDSVDMFGKKEEQPKAEETDEEMNKPEETKQTTPKRKSGSKKDLQPSRRSNRISESVQKREIEAAVKKAQEEMFKEREEQEKLEQEEEERKKKEEEDIKKEAEGKMNTEEENTKEEEMKEEKEEKEDDDKETEESPKKKVTKKTEKVNKPKETNKNKDHEKTKTKSKEKADTIHKTPEKISHNEDTPVRKQSTEKPAERKRTKSESDSSNLFAVGVDHEVYSKVKHKQNSSEHEPGKENNGESSSSEENNDSDEEPIDEDDSDYDPEYDPQRLWCICRKPHGNRFMICCDNCEEWLHGDCVSITKEIGKEMEKNRIEYICPRCVIAKRKLKEQGIEPNKDSQAEGSSSMKKRRRHRRLKIPGEKHHRHSADSTTKTEKRRKRERHDRKSKEDSHRDHHGDKRRSIDTSSFYKIPKKVRTTPTPASFSSRTQRKCINTGCENHAETHSVYCSDSCITKHAQEAINLLHEERKKRMASSHKPTSSHSSGINVPMPWESSNTKTPSSPQVKERVAVIERSTGRVIAGVAAPAEQELIHWLHRHPTFEVIKPSVSKEVKKKDKREEEKTIRDNVKRTLKDILLSRVKEVPALKLTPEDIAKISINIEEDLYKLFGETGPRYKSKYRSLAFNLKDLRNKVLSHQVFSGEVPTDKLVGMTAEQLASQELASWRERETKHTIEMIKQNQLDINATKGHIKKTHKGEIELDEDEDLSTLESRAPSKEKETSEVAEPDSNTSPGPLLVDTTDQHRIHLFDLNCRICTGKIQPPGEHPRQEDTMMLVSTTTTIQAMAESSVPSPPPISMEIPSVSSTDSFDVESVSPPAPVQPVKRDKPVWKGYIMMQSVSKFSTNAFKVSGPCDDLFQMLPDTVHLQGRIGYSQVWDYIRQLRHSTSRDVSVIRYEVSTDDEKTSYVSLYSYFYSRKRCGVVSNCYSGVKDMYMVPLASHSPIPPELLPFDGPGLDEPRPHMLLGIIVRTKAHFKRPRPVQHRSSTSPTPKRRHGSNRKSDESQPKDSPTHEIEDIVFYNKRTSIENKPALSPSSGSSEQSSTLSSPSATGSSVAATSESTEKTALSKKEELQDLADRAKQYIATALKAKDQTEPKDTKKEGNDDEDKPYDPEEVFDLDLELEKPIDDKKPTKAPLKSSDVSSTEDTSSTDNKNTDKGKTEKSELSPLPNPTPQGSGIPLLGTVSSSTPTVTSLPPSIFMPITTAASSSPAQTLSTSKIAQLPIQSSELAGIVKLIGESLKTQANTTTQLHSQRQTDTQKVPAATSATPTTMSRDTREDHRREDHRREDHDVSRRSSGDDRRAVDTSRRSSSSSNTSETDRQRIDRERLEWRERRLSKEGPRDYGASRDHGPLKDHGAPPHDDRWRDQRDPRGPPMRRASDDRNHGDYRGPHGPTGDRGRYQPYHRDDRRGDRRGDRRDDPRWKERWRR